MGVCLSGFGVVRIGRCTIQRIRARTHRTATRVGVGETANVDQDYDPGLMSYDTRSYEPEGDEIVMRESDD